MELFRCPRCGLGFSVPLDGDICVHCRREDAERQADNAAVAGRAAPDPQPGPDSTPNIKPPTAAPNPELRDTGAQLLIVLGGIVTCAVVVLANFLVSQATGFNFLSVSFWFVIPAGAICGGMVAASGYYATARITQTMPSRSLLFNMVAVGASAWIMSKWVSYATLRFDDGARVADVVPFWDFIKTSATTMRLTIGTRYNPHGVTTGELGHLGYYREILQLLGFLAGGFVMYLFLTEVEACTSCRRYAKTKVLLDPGSPEQFQHLLDTASIALPGFVEEAKAAIGQRRLAGLFLSHSQCPVCLREWLRSGVVLHSSRDSTEVRRLSRYSIAAPSGAALVAAAGIKVAEEKKGWWLRLRMKP